MKQRKADSLFKKMFIFFENHEFLRILAAVFVIWLFGASILLFTEGRSNPEFDTLYKSFWNIAVYLFSGLDSGVPVTIAGRIITTVILVLSAGVVAVFTAAIASFLIEKRLRGKMKMPSYELRDHIIICNWNEMGIPLIEQLHADIVRNKRPVVIISENHEAADFPDEDDNAVFENVYLIKGGPTSEAVLKRANIQNVFSVIILADRTQKELADAKSILTCLNIRRTCEKLGSQRDIHICAQGVDLSNVDHLEQAGAEEIVCSEDFGMRLLAHSALSHNLSNVYRRLLTISGDSNEIYQISIPDAFIGKSFSDLYQHTYRTRSAENPLLLLGINSAGDIRINPRPNNGNIIKKDDLAIVVAWEEPELK